MLLGTVYFWVGYTKSEGMHTKYYEHKVLLESTAQGLEKFLTENTGKRTCWFYNKNIGQ